MAFFSPKALANAVSPPEDTLTTTLFVTNLHCASCVSHAQDTISPLRGIFKVDINLLSHTICVQHEPGLTSTIANVLLDAAFEVRHVTTSDGSGRVVGTHDVSSKVEQLINEQRRSWFMSRGQKKHFENCDACQSKAPQQGFVQRLLAGASRKRKRTQLTDEASIIECGDWRARTSEEAITEQPRKSTPVVGRHVATISIVGMTCATCTNAITSELKSAEYIDGVRVNLLSNNATVAFRGLSSEAQKIVDAIEDVGFEASIDSVESLETVETREQSYRAVISIGGMTCGSCVTAVTRGLKEVEGLKSVHVDLVSNSATAHVTDRAVIEKVLEAIDDLGFEGSLAELREDDATAATEQQFRTVEFEITGMYCSACPNNIATKLNESFYDSVELLSTPSLKQPRLTIRYKPSPSSVNIRRIKYTIESADPAIIASIYHPPSIEERSQAVQRKESTRVLRHLLFTLVAAVPSFIIGIVFMSLVPADNSTRMWLERPMWAGDAMRMDWAMFIMTTPVMFYGASIFHTRALKEIWALWRPRSKVPILRRLYRFGSMNLLISAGTSVAYFSSIAILIMEATARAGTGSNNANMKARHSITYFDTVTFLTLFILCGKFLQAYSKAKTGDTVAMLGKLRPTEALLVDDLQAHEQPFKPNVRSVSIDLLEIGDTVSIPHGASPPTDGEIAQEGTFLFDESSLTGESKAVRKIKGDTILTGTVNVSDPVRIVVKELGGKSMLDQIISVVRNGQGKRAPVERFADVVTSYFTPIITLIAISTWVVWLALGESGTLPREWLDVDQGGWAFWSVEFAIAVFVVACPCGLGLAAPTALFVGGGLAAKAGILVQGGGEAFQEATQLNTIIFDKTGTLTEGQMRVTDMQMLSRENDKEQQELIMELTKVLEDSCTHPIAKAIATFCKESTSSRPVLDVSPIEVKELPGHGMQGVFEVRGSGSQLPSKYEVAIGNERQLNGLRETMSVPADGSSKRLIRAATTDAFFTSTLHRFQSTGCSTAIFSMRNEMSGSYHPIAIFAIMDPIRSEAPSVLASLRAQNIDVHMCTGDNATTAQAIASQLGIQASHIRAGATPLEKAEYIQGLQHPQDASSKRKIVAFVGDGTNDTPALAAADVAIALSSGSDVALTSASFILLNSNLTTILHLINLSKRVFRRVKMNFAWAAIYNVALIPVAAGVFFPINQWRLSPVWAAAAMAGSSVSVVLSSLALRLPEMRMKRG